MQTCNSRTLAGYFLLYRSFVKRNMLLSLIVRCVCTGWGCRQQHLDVNAARIGLHTCITVRNKILTKSNVLLQIVTLRHNITVLFKLSSMFCLNFVYVQMTVSSPGEIEKLVAMLAKAQSPDEAPFIAEIHCSIHMQKHIVVITE